MFDLHLTLIIFSCFCSVIRSIPADHVDRHPSPYCIKAMMMIPPAPHWKQQYKCCGSTFWCSHFIKPREKKYGLFNESYEWGISACFCEVNLYRCLTENADFEVILQRHEEFRNERCFAMFWTDNQHQKEEFQAVIYPTISKLPLSTQEPLFDF